MENDITLLNNGLLGKADFISKYGEDEYLKAIGAQVAEAAPDPIIVQEPEQSLGQKAINAMSDIAVGVANGVERAINETAQSANSLGEAAEDALGVGRLVWEDKMVMAKQTSSLLIGTVKKSKPINRYQTRHYYSCCGKLRCNTRS